MLTRWTTAATTPASSAPASTYAPMTPAAPEPRPSGYRDNCKRMTLAPDHRVIRSWARTPSRPVTATVQISPTVVRAYHAAH